MNLGSFIPPIPTSKTNLYAITKEITHSIKVTKYIVGFLNFISSVFLAIVNKSIILYFEITKELNIITSINITPSAKAISVCFAIFFIMEDAVTFVSAAIFILKIFNYGYSIYIIKIIISIPF